MVEHWHGARLGRKAIQVVGCFTNLGVYMTRPGGTAGCMPVTVVCYDFSFFESLLHPI